MSQLATPEPGYYRKRLVRNGPWVPVRVWFHTAERDEAGDLLEDEGLRCEVNGEPRNPYREWESLVLFSEEISKGEYDFMMARRNHAERHDTASPFANPRQSIDLGNMKPVF